MRSLVQMAWRYVLSNLKTIAFYMTNTKYPYRTPETESAATIHGAQLLCESPGQGSNEDLTFENWDI